MLRLASEQLARPPCEPERLAGAAAALLLPLGAAAAAAAASVPILSSFKDIFVEGAWVNRRGRQRERESVSGEREDEGTPAARQRNKSLSRCVRRPQVAMGPFNRGPSLCSPGLRFWLRFPGTEMPRLPLSATAQGSRAGSPFYWREGRKLRVSLFCSFSLDKKF